MNRFAVALVILCSLIATDAFAQVDRATLAGTVKDTADAVVPGATVTVTNLATNVVVSQTTSGAGRTWRST
jgi:hypothetical protein